VSVTNGYTTLTNIKSLKRITSVSASDDSVIETLISAASRAFDSSCGGRSFFPRVSTRLYDIPSKRMLLLDDDLLALTTLLNGDATTLLVADYILEDANRPPYWGIRLRDSSDKFWTWNQYGSSERVISVSGVWGYHTQYASAFVQGTTLAGILNASALTFNVTSGALLTPGHIIMVDSEIMNVSVVNVNAVTVLKRGDNGSTAAIHQDLAPVMVWQPMSDVVAAVEDMVIQAYNKRFGGGAETGSVQVTGAGVVITPRDISDYAKSIASNYRRNF
jgi:hypothetical protein